MLSISSIPNYNNSDNKGCILKINKGLEIAPCIVSVSSNIKKTPWINELSTKVNMTMT